MPDETFVLCHLTAEDYSDVVDLWQRSGLHIRPEGRDGRAAFARQLVSGLQHVLGLRQDSDLLVAVAVLTHDGRKGWINRLAVDPAYRRRGLAQVLVAAAERWFTEDQGLEVWAALIEEGNHASRSLFAGLGYQRVEVVYVTKRTRPEA